MESEFKIGDIVWAKMKGFPPWPGKVVEPKPEVKKPSDKKPKQFIFFFGSENYAWILEELIWPFGKYKDAYKSPSRMYRGFHEAVETAEKQDDSPPSLLDDEDNLAPGTIEKIFRQPKKKSETTRKYTSKVSATSSTPASFKKRLLEKDPTGTQSEKQLSQMAKMTSYDFDNEEPVFKRQNLRFESGDYFSPSEGYMPDVLPSIDETLSSKNIIATPMRIGFLGLGMIGCGMVDNLLRSGHEVTVWNRTTSKCYEFTKDGALKGSTPAEVVQLCDITFSCVSDPSALKDLVFGNCGVLQGISSGKGYVDMSTVDIETITDVQEAIESKGGRFLEAPVIGNRLLAKNGQLIVLAAGDRSLFEDCYSCFQAISKHKFHLGEVGSATKMKLVLTVMFGASLAGLAECLALSMKLGLDTTEVMKVIGYSAISSSFLQEKGSDMIRNKIAEPSCKLQVMQKDLRLAINMSDNVDQPLHVSSAVNELFKKAKAKGYGDDDIASLYRAADL